MRVLILTLLIFICGNVSAQNYERLISKGKFEKVGQKLQKVLSKNPNDVKALYFYSKFYLQDNNPEKDFEKAYYNATNAEDAFEKIQVSKEKDKLDKEGINPVSLQENRLTVCRLALEDINKSPSINQYEGYLRKYPLAEKYAKEAIMKRDSLAFNMATKVNEEQSFQSFIDKYPTSMLKNLAIAKRDSLAYDEAISLNDIESYQEFLTKYPESYLVKQAKMKRDSVAFSLAAKANSEESYKDFIEKYPNSNEVEHAKIKLEDLSFQNAVKDSSLGSIDSYIKSHPNSKFISKAEAIKQVIILKDQKIEVEDASRILKTYSGNFGGGTATYQYYEDKNLERIFNGNFTFKVSRSEAEYTVEGSFHNNKKNGLWKCTNIEYNVQYYPNKHWKMEKTVIGNTSLVGHFVNGKMNGFWKYTKTEKSYNGESIVKTANFKDNNFSGDYEANDENTYHSNGIRKLHIKGKFSNGGLCDSSWIITDSSNDGIKYDNLLKFNNGVLFSLLRRNLSTGDIIAKGEDSTSFKPLDNHSKIVYQIKLGNHEGTKDSVKNLLTNRLLANNFYGFCPMEAKGEIEISNMTSGELSSSFRFWLDINNANTFGTDRGSNEWIIYPEACIIANYEIHYLDNNINK